MPRFILALAFMAFAILMFIQAALYLEDFQAQQAAGELTLAGHSLVGMLLALGVAVIFVVTSVIAIFWNKVKAKL